MLILKMNVKEMKITEIIVNHSNIHITFKDMFPLILDIKKHQIKQIYNKIRNQEKKERKVKQKWLNKR